MFAAASNRKVQRITLALAVGNSIVRKHLVPRTTINADIGPLDPAGSVLDLKIYSNAIRGDLGADRVRTTGGLLSISTGSLVRSPDRA